MKLSRGINKPAGPAAIAFACERERFQLHPQRLKAYWEWWVQVALPDAAARVEVRG
ncbi:MAG: hypothetical protein OHK0022_52100 [Roseiflexaceae bacterium]